MMLNKDKNNKPSKAGKKIRLKPALGGITRYIGTAVATVLIVGVGVFIPAFLLRSKSDIKNLPQGYADIADVQPYGAEYAQSALGLRGALGEWDDYTIYNSSNIDLTAIPHTDAYRSNGYAGIGIQDPEGTGAGASTEFVYAYTNLLAEDFGYEAPEIFEVRNISPDLVLVGDNPCLSEGFLLDRSTGVPISMGVIVTSGPDGLTEQQMNRLFNQTVALYNDFTGLDFFEDNGDAAYDPDELMYSHSMKSSNGDFVITTDAYGDLYYPTDGSDEAYTVWWITFTVTAY